MPALVIAEHTHAALKASTLHTVIAAAHCADEVHILIAGHHCAGAAQAAARTTAVTKVLVADAAQFADGLAENATAQILALLQSAPGGYYTHILAPASAFGKNVLPRVAALLDVAQISEITKVHAPDTFERPIYAGNAIATIQAGDAVKVITVRTSGFEAALNSGCASIESITPVSCPDTSAFLSRTVTVSDRPELSAANIVVSGGRGLASSDNFKMLEPLADKLGAAIGASRAAVDAGFAPNDWQVGQTGKIVAPDLYIAIGISGAIQHLAGMRGSKTIVAINKDPEAAIFGVADYGIVGDLFEIVPQLTNAL